MNKQMKVLAFAGMVWGLMGMSSPLAAQTFEVDSNVFTGPVVAEVKSGWNDTEEWSLSGEARPGVILICPQGVVEGAMTAVVKWRASPIHASVSQNWGVNWSIDFVVKEALPEPDRRCAEEALSVLRPMETFFEVAGGRAHQSIPTDYGQHDWWSDLPTL